MALAPNVALRLAFAAGLAAIALGAFALPATRVRVTGESALAAQSARGRGLLWGETLQLIKGHPALGVGPSGYVDAIPAYHDASYELEFRPSEPVDSPHDWILQAAASGGVAVALLGLALAGLTLRRGFLALGRQATSGEAAVLGGMLAGLGGYCAALLFHFTSPGTAPLAAVFAGALLAAGPGADGQPEHDSGSGMGNLRQKAGTPDRARRPVRVALQVTLGALILVLACAAAAEIPLRTAIDAAASGRLSAADSDFRLARTLRPWDGAIAATAAHAYAVLVLDGAVSAGERGAPWARDELRAYPHSPQALADSAVMELALDRPDAASALLAKALSFDPANPSLRALASQATSAKPAGGGAR